MHDAGWLLANDHTITCRGQLREVCRNVANTMEEYARNCYGIDLTFACGGHLTVNGSSENYRSELNSRKAVDSKFSRLFIKLYICAHNKLIIFLSFEF